MKTEPTFETATTKIWKDSEHTDNPFSVGRWIVFAPWVHPMWNYHFCGVVHLRDVEGRPPANMQFPEATHEFDVLSLNPDHEPDFGNLRYLTPGSIGQQFAAKNDTEALEIIELLMQRVLHQQLSIDSDFRSLWKHLLTEHTIDDFRKG